MKAECIYCNHDVEEIDAPAIDDADAWQDLAKEHAADCEWILTRAHRCNHAGVPGFHTIDGSES